MTVSHGVFVPVYLPATAGRLNQRILRMALYITVASSFFVIVEPAPYEGLAAFLMVAAVIGGVTIQRPLVPLILLLIAFNIGGAISLIEEIENSKASTFTATSAYLALTAIVYACIVTQDTVRRFLVIRNAYILAALLASIAGIAGYFNILGTAEMFTLSSRASGTFKDPNVFSPFLILPLLLIGQELIVRSIKPLELAAGGIILAGLFLGFSRGAWGHFAFSAALMLWLMFVTSTSTRTRTRIVGLSILAGAGIAAVIFLLLTIPAVSDLLANRAELVQDYDVGSAGRFAHQIEGLSALLVHPGGMGPYGFQRDFGLNPHNVYLFSFLAYGWLGGVAYITLTVLTLVIGFRTVFVRTPWQPCFIATLATYVGLMFEGFIIDTDHWRHYFLLVGLVWGLAAATMRAARPSATM